MDREIIKLTIPNYNNKLASFQFVHIFKSMGKYGIWEFQENLRVEIDGVEGTWIVYDIGHDLIKNIPQWICYMSHGYGIGKRTIQQMMNISPETRVYWFLFIREDIYNTIHKS